MHDDESRLAMRWTIQRPVIAAALMSALVVHNAEEALTYASYRARSSELVARLLGHRASFPTPRAFLLALTAVTAAGLMTAAWAGSGRQTSAKRSALTIFASVMLANVFIPHVPAAFALGGYAPGVATALVINLPVTIVALRALTRLRSEA